MALGVLALHGHEDERGEQLQAVGKSLAGGLAGLATEPLADGDRITLGVLASRVNGLEPVAGVTIYTVADDMLAIAGEPQRGRAVIEPVVQDNTVIGYARVSLVVPEDKSSAGALALTVLLVLLTGPLVVAAAGLKLPALPQPTAAAPASAQVVEVTLTPKARYLLVVNLFNQLSLKPEVREQELTHAHHVANQVADLYTGHVQPLRGTGLVVEFNGGDDVERPFQIVCAAFLLSRLLRETDTHGHYRLGSHLVNLRDDEVLEPISAEVRDAALLSAVAKSGCLVVSDELFQRLARRERVAADPMSNPLLHQLETTAPNAWLLSALAAPYDALLAQQAQELGYADGSPSDTTSRESTF